MGVKKPLTVMNTKLLRVDMTELLAEVGDRGVSIEEAAGLLHDRERYQVFPHAYLLEWAESMLQKLKKEQLVTQKHDRYFMALTSEAKPS